MLLAFGMVALVAALVLVAYVVLAGRTAGAAVDVGVDGAIEVVAMVQAAREPKAPSALGRRLARVGAAPMRKDYLTKLQHRLDLAGNPSAWLPERVLAMKGAGLIGGVLLGLTTGAKHGPALAVLLMVLFGGAGLVAPDLIVRNLGEKRQLTLQRQLPDAMDMLTICVEAGLGFDAALAQVARNSSGPLAAELARALQEMQIGKNRTEALRSMAGRTTAPELRAFASALVQAGELGISVASVLREQAKEMRLRRRQWAEEQAQKVPVKILFPLLFCLFPALFVVIMGPAAITISHLFFQH